MALAISRDQLDDALALATRLIARAPGFAEAYNQRAIVYFLQGRFAESIQDCKEVLARNPFHFGAISGMAQSQDRLNRPQDVLESLAGRSRSSRITRPCAKGFEPWRRRSSRTARAEVA